MPLVKAKCTSCGASLEVDDSKEAAVCPACGTPYIVEKAIYNYTTNNTNNINAETVNIINGKEDFTIVAGVLEKYTGKESEITIPDEVVSICSNSMPEGITAVNFTENSKLKEIGSFAFSDCKKLSSISIPSGVTNIGAFAFKNCVKLVSISIPSTVKEIGTHAFLNCRSLESVRLPDTIEKLEYTFTDCSSLKTVDIYAASSGEVENKSIWISAFSGCASLKYIRIPSTVKRLGEEESRIKEKTQSSISVNDKGETEYHSAYPYSVYRTQGYPADNVYNGDVFNDCKSLEKVDIDNDYELDIVRSTFKGCVNLKEIYSKNPDKVTYYYVEDDGSFNQALNFYSHNLVTKGGNVLNDTFSRARRSSLYSNTELPPLQTNFPQPAPKPVAQPSGPCYVATCVYGSYDCPQVWTLRRWRDNTLAETWYGRAFIHVYYSISPTLVRWFGKTKWFKRMWQGKLDRMVKNLNAKGVEDTPYQDKKW